MATTKLNTKVVNASVKSPASEAPAKQVLEFDYAAYAEQHGDLVTFLTATVENDKPVLKLRSDKRVWKVLYDSQMQYGPLVKSKTTMKVIIDKDEAGWVLLYPNKDTHPLPQKKEVVELPEFLKARAKAIRG